MYLEIYSSVQGSFLSFSSLIRRRFFMHSRYFLSVDQSQWPLGVFMQMPWFAWQSVRDESELRLVSQRQASLIRLSFGHRFHHGQSITWSRIKTSLFQLPMLQIKITHLLAGFFGKTQALEQSIKWEPIKAKDPYRVRWLDTYET
jgi:hypothetical protein